MMIIEYKIPAIIKKNHEPGAVFIYTVDKDGNGHLTFVCNAATEIRKK